MNEDPTWYPVGRQLQIVAVNASGLTAHRLLSRTLEELNTLPPDALTAELAVADTATSDALDEVLVLIGERISLLNRRVLLIIDGIEEMQDPHEGARIVASLAKMSGAKVIVASRDKPNDGQPFMEYASLDLTRVVRGGEEEGGVLAVRLHSDPEAINRYLRRRLETALPDAQIRQINKDVGNHVSDFLHANLLIQEVVAEPEWATGGLLRDLAQADVTELYGLLLDRLNNRNPAFLPIFQACALAQGRGVPVADEVWLTIARTVAGQADGLTPKALSDFLDVAQSHIRIDTDHDQTVFRPAHSILRQFLVNTLGTLTDVRNYHAMLAELCAVRAASPPVRSDNKEFGAGPQSANPYYQYAATMHARQSDRDGWWAIDRLGPGIWKNLNSHRIVEDAMRDLFGRTRIPQEVENLILSHHYSKLGPEASVDGWPQALREGRRRAIRSNGAQPRNRGNAVARVRWARGLARQPVFLSLPGHRGRITALHKTELGPNEPGLLVGTASGDLWLWNLQSAGLVASLDGLDSAVFALTSIVTEGGLIVTAGDSSGHLISWEVKTRKKLWGTGRGGDLNQPQALHRRVVEPIGPVTAAQLHRLSDALVCVVAIHEDRVRLLNAGDGSVITAADPTISPLGPRFAPQLAVTFGDEGEYVVAVVARDQLGYYPFTVKGEGSSWTLARHELVGLAIQIVAIRPHPSVRSTFRVLTSDGEIIESNPMVVAGLPPGARLMARRALRTSWTGIGPSPLVTSPALQRLSPTRTSIPTRVC